TSAGGGPGNARVTLRRPARREVVSRESVLLLPASTSPNAGRARVPLRPSVTGEASTERPTQSRVAPPALEPATRGLRIRVVNAFGLRPMGKAKAGEFEDGCTRLVRAACFSRCWPELPAIPVGRAGIEPATLGLRVPCSTS